MTSILLSVWSTALGHGVNSEQAPAFEVASVKPSDPGKSGSSFNFVPSGLEIAGGTLRSIMETACSLRTFQILGGPNDDPALQGLSQEDRIKEIRRRLQTLLAEPNGRYDFELIWSPDSGCGSWPNNAAAVTDEPADRPSLFTALQEQLGLKLEAIKGPVEVVVVDRVEKPDSN